MLLWLVRLSGCQRGEAHQLPALLILFVTPSILKASSWMCSSDQLFVEQKRRAYLASMYSCTGYVRRVTHDEIADAVG